MADHNETKSPGVPADNFSELYSQFFTPIAGATQGNQPPAAMPFKIFSLTKNNVNLVYSNNSKR